MAQVFTPLPSVPDHPALEREMLDAGGRSTARSSGCASRTAAARPGASSTGRSPPTTRWASTTPGAATLKDVFQRYKALQRLRPALPERLRLPGALGRGRGREVARPQLEARDRGVRPRRVRRALPRARRRVRGRDRPSSRSASACGWTGTTPTHVLATRTSSTSGASCKECQRRGWLYKGHRSTEWCPRCGTSISQHELFAGELQGARAPVALRALPAQGARGRGARRLDDDALDAARQRRGRGQAGRRVRAQRPGRVARARARGRRRGGSHARAARSSSGSSTTGRSTGCLRRKASSIA